MSEIKRIAWIDVAKGLGIFLVVVGHLMNKNENFVSHWIYSFHVPLFFFLSGICLKNDRVYSNFIMRRIKSLILPYLFFGVLITFMELGMHSIEEIYAWLKKWFFNYGAMWFIPVLFIVELLFFPISKIKNKFIFILIILISAFIGWKLYDLSIYFPMSLTAIFAALFFYGLGFLSKNFYMFFLEKKLYILFFLSLHILMLIIWRNTCFGMVVNKIPDPLVNYSTAIIGIIAFCLICDFLPRIKWKSIKKFVNLFTFLGVNTLVILCLHMEFIGYSVKYIKPYFDSKIMYKGIEFLFVILMCYVSILIINRYFPWMVNKKKSNQ